MPYFPDTNSTMASRQFCMQGQSGAWEQSGAAQQAWHEPAQRAQHVQQQAQHAQQQAQHAQQQAQRLYHQQLMQQQEQYRSQQRPAMHSNFDAFQGTLVMRTESLNLLSTHGRTHYHYLSLLRSIRCLMTSLVC